MRRKLGISVLIYAFLFVGCFYHHNLENRDMQKITLKIMGINETTFVDYNSFIFQDSLNTLYYLMSEKVVKEDTIKLLREGYVRIELNKQYNLTLEHFIFHSNPKIKMISRPNPEIIILEGDSLIPETILWSSDSLEMRKSLISQNKIYKSDMIKDVFIKVRK